MSFNMFDDDDSLLEEMPSSNHHRLTRVLLKSEIVSDESFDGDKTILADEAVDYQDPDYEERLRGMTSEQVVELIHKLNLEENNTNANSERTEIEDETATETENETQKKIRKPNKKKENPIQSKKIGKVNIKAETASESDSQNKKDITAPTASLIKEEIKAKRGKNKKEDIKTKEIDEDALPPSKTKDEIKVKKGKRGNKDDVNNVELNSAGKQLEDIEHTTINSGKNKKGARGKQISSENIKDEINHQVNNSKNKSKVKEIIGTTSSQETNDTQHNKSKAVSKAGKKLHSEVSDSRVTKSKLGTSSEKNSNIIEKEVTEMLVKSSTSDLEKKEAKVKQAKSTKKVNSNNVGEIKSEENLAKTKKATSKDGVEKDVEKLNKANTRKKNQQILKEVNEPVDKPVESKNLPEQTEGRPKRGAKKDNTSEPSVEISLENSKAEKLNTKSGAEREKVPELTKRIPKMKNEKSSKEKLPNKENKEVKEGETTKRATRKK